MICLWREGFEKRWDLKFIFYIQMNTKMLWYAWSSSCIWLVQFNSKWGKCNIPQLPSVSFQKSLLTHLHILHGVWVCLFTWAVYFQGGVRMYGVLQGCSRVLFILLVAASAYKRPQTAAAPAPSSLYSKRRSLLSVSVLTHAEQIFVWLCRLGLEWNWASTYLCDRQVPCWLTASVSVMRTICQQWTHFIISTR